MEKQRPRIISLILIFALLITSSPFPAVTSKAHEPEIAEKCDLKQIPEVMENDEELLKGPVLRLDTDEDPLNVIRYLESWDSQKTIIFPVDVKYVDRNGIIKDKSNKLYASDRQGIAFETRDNDILTAFSVNSLNGIQSNYLDYSISICPDTEFSSEAEIDENGHVVYRDAFGEGIDFAATPTFSGNKTDIILNDIPASNCFRFKIETDGATLSEENGAVSVDCDGTVVCRFSEVYIKDSEGHITFGSLNVIDNNTIEIEVPQDFLEDNQTVFPVLVDPILYFVTNRAYSGDNINTAQLNSFGCMNGGTIVKSSLMAFAQSGTSNFVHPVVRFPYLYAVIQNMDNVQSASLILFRESKYNGTANTTITAKPITTYWYETYYNASQYSTIYYATSSNYNATSTLKAGASASGSNSFTITSLVNYWRQGNWVNGNGVYGISFSIGTYSYPATFHGGLTATSSKMPRLSISHSYTATGQIQNGIYFISPAVSLSGGGTNYCLTRTVSGNTVKATTTLMGDCATQNYPITNSGYISYMRDLNQLYKIEYTNVGYRIKCLKTGQYLAFQNGSDLCYVTNDDAINYTTRWSFVKVNGKYYIVSYFGHFLTVDSPLDACDVDVNLYYESDGILWSLKQYCLDVAHRGQLDYSTCGPTCDWMVLNYLNVDVSNVGLRDPNNMDPNDPYYNNFGVFGEYLKEIGHQASSNYGSYGCEQVCAALNYYLPNNYTNWMNPYYSSSVTLAEYTACISHNLTNGYPVILQIQTNSNDNLPFTNIIPNHFIVVIGLFSDANGVNKAIIADPYPTSDPSFVDLTHSPARNPAYAYMEINVSDLFTISTRLSHNMICNYFDF